MHALILAADPASTTLANAAASAGFGVRVADTEEGFLGLTSSITWDVIVVDGGYSSAAGTGVIRSLRSGGLETPALLVTDAGNAVERITALNAGADDCICRPFHAGELAARLRAITHRVRNAAPPCLQVGSLLLNTDRQEAAIGETLVPFTGKEFAVLHLMAMRKAAVLTKLAILNHLYGGDDHPNAKIVDVFVCKIRKKLAMAGIANLIGTVWGQGYQLADPGDGGLWDKVARHEASRHVGQAA